MVKRVFVLVVLLVLSTGILAGAASAQVNGDITMMRSVTRLYR